MYFTVEEENLICMYHNADRRRTIGRITAALPDMDEGMQTLAQQILSGRGGHVAACVRRLSIYMFFPVYAMLLNQFHSV